MRTWNPDDRRAELELTSNMTEKPQDQGIVDGRYVTSHSEHKVGTHEETVASEALAQAVAAAKPRLWTPSMLRLYFIMAISYLIATMNGFGTIPQGQIAQ